MFVFVKSYCSAWACDVYYMWLVHANLVQFMVSHEVPAASSLTSSLYIYMYVLVGTVHVVIQKAAIDHAPR